MKRRARPMLTGARRAAIVLLLLLCTQISAAQSTGTSFDYAAFAKAFDGQCDGPLPLSLSDILPDMLCASAEYVEKREKFASVCELWSEW